MPREDRVMMDQLVRLAEELRAGVQGRLQNVLPGNVQGALLQVDRYWFEWAAAQQIGPLWPEYVWRRRRWLGHRADSWPLVHVYGAPVQWSFGDKPPDWEDYCRTAGYGEGASPVVIRVLLRRPLAPRSPHAGTSEAELPRRYEDHPMLYEVRPPAVASGVVAIISRVVRDVRTRPQTKAPSIGRAEPRTSGTLGGYLACPATGGVYLVSCAHVLGAAGSDAFTPGPFENRGSTRIGTTVYSEIPPAKIPGQDCNFWGLPDAGRLDVALAECKPIPSAADGVRPTPSCDALRRAIKMVPYQPVAFIGKESGWVDAQLSGATLWLEIEFEDFGDGLAGPRCFGTLFELSDFAGDRRTVARPGDSGAWVFDNSDGLRCWNGILIARQGHRAYGCYADLVMQSLSASPQFPGGLAIVW
jgi:hypothetical protein